MAMVKIVTSPNSSFLPEDETLECSSSQEISEKLSDDVNRSRNIKHSQKKEKKRIEKEQEVSKSESTIDVRDIDGEYPIEDKEEGTYVLAASGNSTISTSILNEPSNFMVSPSEIFQFLK